jgi:hypothetical protein
MPAMRSLLPLAVVAACLSSTMGCAPHDEALARPVAAADVLPANSYFLQALVVALPREDLHALGRISTYELSTSKTATIYRSSAAVMAVEGDPIRFPAQALDEPSDDPLVAASRIAQLELRASAENAPVDPSSARAVQLIAQLVAPLEAAPAEHQGLLSSDGSRLVFDTGVEHDGKALVIAVTAESVRTRGDLQRIYERKQAERDSAR